LAKKKKAAAKIPSKANRTARAKKVTKKKVEQVARQCGNRGRGLGRKSWKQHKADPDEVAPSDRDLQIYLLAHEGIHTQMEIARQFEVSRGRVTQILTAVGNWMLRRLTDDIRTVKLENHARLQVLYAEAYKGWLASKEDAEESTVTEGGPGGTVTTSKRKGQTGNPAFLRECREILADIRKIWGADAPMEVKHTGEIRVAGKSLAEAVIEKRDQLNRIGNVLLNSSNYTVVGDDDDDGAVK